jgi:N-acetyl-anhydromuramyl-L-alanine amidase AmpD
MPTLAERGIVLRPFEVVAKIAAPENHGSRKNVAVDTLVIHVTQSARNAAQLVARATPSAVMWFADPAAKASAHYVVGVEGRIWQCVAEGDCAWHAGNAAMNRRSVGIEIEGWVEKPATFNPEVMDSLLALSADICRRHGIAVLHQPGPGVCGHSDVPDPTNPNLRGGKGHHTDPGPHFPWAQFLDALRAEVEKENIA